MTSHPPYYYDYYEERPIENTRSTRRRKVSAAWDPVGTPHRDANWSASHYVVWYYSQLEGPERCCEGDVREAAWVRTVMRFGHHCGDPGVARIPERPEQIQARLDAGELPPAFQSLGPRTRIHHYVRLLSADDIVIACGSGGVNVGIEVTEEWHSPKDGVISPIARNSLVLGTHSVAALRYDPMRRLLIFPNSWGDTWGYNGFGAISPEDVDRFMVESQQLSGLGVYPPIQTTCGRVIVMWKASWDRTHVHGREVVDAATGERIAWCFLVRRGHFLDVDEMCVWPTHRGHGLGSLLANLAKEAAAEMKCELRSLIGFVDAYPVDRERLRRITHRLGLELHPSPYRSLAFVGLRNRPVKFFAEPSFPLKPSVPVHKLDPSNATRLYPLWYATNRKPNDPKDANLGYSGQRDSVVHYGDCVVSVPNTHRFGSIGSGFLRRCIRWKDDRLAVVSTTVVEATAFWDKLAETLTYGDAGERQGLVYLHGFNNNFEDAAIRAAQIGYDLRFPGETAFFSWPSSGTVVGYSADEAAIEAAQPMITQFLIDFVKRSSAEKVHVIAHSMGNRGLLRAIEAVAATAQESGVKFGQIVLAAPDLDCDVFRGLSHLYKEVSERTTLYTSRADLAVALSEVLHGYSRVGLSPPVTVVSGIDTIDVPKFNVFDLLGHGYFAEAEGLLHDIFDLVRYGNSPQMRQRLIETQTPDGLTYWRMEN